MAWADLSSTICVSGFAWPELELAKLERQLHEQRPSCILQDDFGSGSTTVCMGAWREYELTKKMLGQQQLQQGPLRSRASSRPRRGCDVKASPAHHAPPQQGADCCETPMSWADGRDEGRVPQTPPVPRPRSSIGLRSGKLRRPASAQKRVARRPTEGSRPTPLQPRMSRGLLHQTDTSAEHEPTKSFPRRAALAMEQSQDISGQQGPLLYIGPWQEFMLAKLIQHHHQQEQENADDGLNLHEHSGRLSGSSRSSIQSSSQVRLQHYYIVGERALKPSVRHDTRVAAAPRPRSAPRARSSVGTAGGPSGVREGLSARHLRQPSSQEQRYAHIMQMRRLYGIREDSAGHGATAPEEAAPEPPAETVDAWAIGTAGPEAELNRVAEVVRQSEEDSAPGRGRPVQLQNSPALSRPSTEQPLSRSQSMASTGEMLIAWCQGLPSEVSSPHGWPPRSPCSPTFFDEDGKRGGGDYGQ